MSSKSPLKLLSAACFILASLRTSLVLASTSTSTLSQQQAEDDTARDDCALGSGNGTIAPASPSLAYCYAQQYVQHRNKTLTNIYFPHSTTSTSDPSNSDANANANANANNGSTSDGGGVGAGGFKRVKHLIVGRGVASLNLFSARYTNVVEYDHADSPYTCTNTHDNDNDNDNDNDKDDEHQHQLFLHNVNGDGSDVLMVGDELTGLWNTATYTLAQPLSALTFPYLPYNPVDFVSPARVKRDEFTSCINMHQALLTSQCATRAPVLSALVHKIQLAAKVDVGDDDSPRGDDCINAGGIFLVTLWQVTQGGGGAGAGGSVGGSDAPAVQEEEHNSTTPITSYLCVDEIDIATGRGQPRSIFPLQGVDKKLEIAHIQASGSSGFGSAPAVINFRDFVLAPDEMLTSVATPKKDGTVPTIIVDGGGGTVLAAIRRAMMGVDDISKNIVYSDPVDSSFRETKNTQMLLQVLRNPYTQNAKVIWVSQGDLDDGSLRGENQVRAGSAYDIVNVYSASPSKSVYGEFGSMNSFHTLCCIDTKLDPTTSNPSSKSNRVATFCPYRKDAKRPKCDVCCKEEASLNIPFDQLVTCIGEDDTIERRELYGNSSNSFGDSTIFRGLVQPSFNIPYAVGFVDTGPNLRIFGSAATSPKLFPKGSIDTFTTETQLFADDGQVVPVQFIGNMLAMMSQVQVYTTTVLKKRIAKINLSMSTNQFILRFLTEACVPSETSNAFVHHLQSINNNIQSQNNINWPMNPNGIGEKDLRDYIESHEELSKNVFVSRGKTLTSKHNQPCTSGGYGDGAGVQPSPPRGLLNILRSIFVQASPNLTYFGIMLL